MLANFNYVKCSSGQAPACSAVVVTVLYY